MKPLFQLITIAIISGLLWRLEVEYHGWDDLGWVTYFHWALPASALLFIAWANGFIGADAKKRTIINIVAVVFVIALYFSFKIVLTYIFAAGPTSMMLVVDTPEWQLLLVQNSIYLLIPLIPIGIYTILKVFQQTIAIKYLLVSIISMVMAIPFSIKLLEVLEHKGGYDLIHTIKSGFLIPLWIISFGFLILGLQRRE